MTKNHQISIQEQIRKDCVLLLRSKVPRKKISRVLKISDRTICRVNKKFKQRRSVKRKYGSKGVKKLIQADKIRIYHLISHNPFLSCIDIVDRLNLQVTRQCVRLYLINSGFVRRRPDNKFRFTEKHIQDRLNFADEMIRFLFIPEIVFTDEASVWLFDNNHEGWFHRDSNHELSIDKHAGKIHCFGAVDMLGGKLVIHTFHGNMDAMRLTEILRDVLLPEADYFYPDGWVLGHDNGPTFTAGTTQHFLRNNGPIQLKWPSKSPDLNPIENVWHLLKQNVRKRLPSTVEELENCIHEEWERLDDNIIKKICESFPERIRKCIQLHGQQVRN